MALHVSTGDLFLPHQHKDDDTAIPSQYQIPTTISSPFKLKPPAGDSLLQANHNHKDDDFVADLTRQMAHFMFQDDDQLSFEMSCDSMDSPQSTLWPPLGMGSPEGPSQESSPPATPANSKPSCAWDSQHVLRMFEKKINLDDRAHSNHSHGNGMNSSKDINVSHGLCSNQAALINQQIRAIQEQVQKQKQSQALAQTVQSQSKQQVQQFLKKGKTNGGIGTCNGNGRRARPTPPALSPVPPQQQGGSSMRAVFLGGSSTRSGSCGTGVFLPRGSGSSAPSESRKKIGCSTVLIPARVVQALKQHFDQIAATCGPKAVNLPPLHDVVVSSQDGNRNGIGIGMYSLQKRVSGKAEANNMQKQNDMNLALPQEWTY